MAEKENEGEKKKKGENVVKKGDETTPATVVLKIDMHCEGCAFKIVKCVRGFEGVETAKSDTAVDRLTVTGTIDPSSIKEKLQEKIKKKVDLISPQPKKEKQNNNNNFKQDKESNQDKNKKSKDKKDNDKNVKKPKEVSATTVVLKVRLHCRGCIEKIHKALIKTKGVEEVWLDKQKELVTVHGTMDVKTLTARLTAKLKRPVEIVPQKKEEKVKEINDVSNGGGNKKNVEKDGVDGGGGINKMEVEPVRPVPGPVFGSGSGFGYGYAYPPPCVPSGYNYYPMQIHAPQIFSDENPNACSLM